MSSSVIPFRKKVGAVGWRHDELAECYRVVGLLARSGLPVSIDSGLTDEGEPWAIVLREDTGDVLLHMARLDGSFVLVSAAGPVAQRGESLRAVLDTAVRTGGLAMLTRSSAAADSNILRLHPTTLIAAFIAAAWVHTETSQADLLQASARREEGSISRTDEARLTGVAVQPPSAALATAAASFAAVAAALYATQADPVLDVTVEDFIQAALDLVADVDSAAPVKAMTVSIAPVELANLELGQDGTLLTLAMMSEPRLSVDSTDNAYSLTLLPTVLTPASMHAPDAGGILQFSAQRQDTTQSSSLAWGAAGEHSLLMGPQDIADFMHMEVAAPVLAATPSAAEGQTPITGPVTGTPEPVRLALVVTPTPVQEVGDAPVVRATLPITLDETGLFPTHFSDMLTLIFKSAIQILRFDQVAPLTNPEAIDSTGTNDGGAPTASKVTLASASVSEDTNGALPSKATLVVSPASPAPVAQEASLPQTAPSDYNISGVGRPLTVAVQPPPSNAQLLLEFITRTQHVVSVDRSGFTDPLLGPLDTGDARKVVVFDASWLQAKSFMLMPGVMMMEDDLLGGVNRAGMEMKGSPVSLHLGDGLSLTLLGVVDFGLT